MSSTLDVVDAEHQASVLGVGVRRHDEVGVRRRSPVDAPG
jgi:hypothetical protein